MKLNGKSVRVVVFALCGLVASSIAGQAQSARGMFKLPVETHWGTLVLAPGEYEFTATDALAGRIVTVRSLQSGRSGMVLASDSSQPGSVSETKLLLTKSETGMYVRTLYLGDSGVMLNYGAPKSTKVTWLSPAQSSTMASAAGSN